MKHTNWKVNTKDHQYGNRETVKYETPFMVLDTNYLENDDTETVSADA